MSPEQAAGRAVDFRSDQFSLGTILYELATGRRPFARDTSAETLTAIIREEPEPLLQAAPRLPAPLRWLIERCLAKDPEERYASTKDLARELELLRRRLPETSGSGETPAVTGDAGERPLPDLPAPDVPARNGALRALRPRRPDRDLRRDLGGPAVPAVLDAPREPGVERALAARRRDPGDLRGGPDGALARPSLGRALHLERDAGAGAASGRSAARDPRGRAVGRLGPRRREPRRDPPGRGQVPDRVPDRQRAVRDRRLGQPPARVARRRARGVPAPPCARRRRRRRRQRGARERPQRHALGRLDHALRARLAQRERDLVHGHPRRRRPLDLVRRRLGRPRAPAGAHAGRADDPGHRTRRPHAHDERQRDGRDHRRARGRGRGARPVAARLVAAAGHHAGRQADPVRRVGRGRRRRRTPSTSGAPTALLRCGSGKVSAAASHRTAAGPSAARPDRGSWSCSRCARERLDRSTCSA